ncbi:ribonuclease [Lachnospiraceae bacterium WCA-9-b2]|uniref:Ribonuclease n=1 Tax=Sporofaciens musculi TaxID=2681861 RepID=A0A7X3MJ13_9FIRM|nr:ribonuclease domain-containing protein [Sporofaciens musculi]MCI9422810.1 ribonuclease [Dorea sp.]MXP77333.1 ribonuclease [Sporofaciens musculi]
MKHILENHIKNHVKSKKWLQYFLASLLIFVLTITGCGAVEENDNGNTGDTAVSKTVESEPDTLPEEASEPDTPPEEASEPAEDGVYSSKDDVAQYIHIYGHLPSNFITKKDAEKLGWQGGSLEPYAPGKCIGGSHFGNYEGILPEKEGRTYTECDIDTLGADKRGAKRIVFSNDGLIYYTEDHYESFELLYGED